MFQTGAFNQIPMGFQYPGQQPTASIYSSQFGGFNPQVPAPFQQVPPPPRGQSLPASGRQFLPPAGPYAPASTRRNGQYPPPAPPQHHEYRRHGSKSKKHRKQRSVSPKGVADQTLYSDKEKNDRSRSHSPVSGSPSKQEEVTNNDQEQRSQTVDSASGEISQGGTIGTEEQPNTEENDKRKSRSKKNKHNRHENNNHSQQPQQQPAFYGELPPQMRVHQQPLYSGYNQAYEESIRRGDVYQKQAKRSTRLPPEAKQQLLPHEDDQQKQFPFAGYPQQPFPGIQQSFNPYQPYATPQPGFFGPPAPFNTPQPWPNVGGLNGPAEQEIHRLRNHIHTLEGELHKLQKKLNKTTLNNDENNGTHQRSKHNDVSSPRQTPVIVELNNAIGEASSKKHRHRKSSHVNSQQGQNPAQQAGENNTDQNASNQQQADPHPRPQISETEGKPSSKSAREETAAQLAHAAAAHVNARQQVPAPPPVQQQYLYQQGILPPQTQQIYGSDPRFTAASNIRYPNDPYQQRNVLNSNFNQSNNNELLDNKEEQRNRRSADKILDAFERFYMNKSTTAPMKVKYIPEENNSNHLQRNTNNNNNNRSRSTSQSSSSSTWSNADGSSSSTRDGHQNTRKNHLLTSKEKKLETELKRVQQDLKGLQAKIKVDSNYSPEKIAELQQVDVQQRELQQLLSGYTEKLVDGKIQRQAYLHQEQLLRNKLRDINTRISAIINQY